MKMRNINGTSANTCSCGSWLGHWKAYSGQKVPEYCPEKTCLEKSEVGAHVQKDSSSDYSWYIIPLCKKHNGMRGESVEIGDWVTLVSANVSKTCG